MANWTSDELDKIGKADELQIVTLRRHVDAVCVSQTAGVWKPDPAIFETALRDLGVDPAADRSGYWMVGDALPFDIAGGVAAGIPTIWLHRDRELPPDGPKPDHSVASILDAFAVIGDQLAA